jgi:hypothetical protein
MQGVNTGGVVCIITGIVAAPFLFRIILRRFEKLPKDNPLSVNLSRDAKCPVCGEALPHVRWPETFTKRFMADGRAKDVVLNTTNMGELYGHSKVFPLAGQRAV